LPGAVENEPGIQPKQEEEVDLSAVDLNI
jgi:hypothetical protein